MCLLWIKWFGETSVKETVLSEGYESVCSLAIETICRLFSAVFTKALLSLALNEWTDEKTWDNRDISDKKHR